MNDISEDVIERAQKNLGGESREDTVEMSLFLACVIENADEILGVHGYGQERRESDR